MISTLRMAVISLVAACTVSTVKADGLSEVVDDLREADCVRMTFLSVTTSDFFGYVDSVDGNVYFAADNRYRVSFGPDTYLYTGDTLYSYSAKYNQVTIEPAMRYLSHAEQVNWLRQLDRWYDWEVGSAGHYALVRKDDDLPGDLPDRMTVSIDSVAGRIAWIEYEDINGDENRLIVNEQRLDSKCRDSLFVPDFPDSAEIIIMP